MGTNFYYKIPLKKRQVKELQDMITENPDFYEIKEKFSEIESSNNIHLGKRSAGWQFLWDSHQGRYFGANLKSIKHFLETSDGYIEDEYGEKFTVEQFLNEEITLYKDKDHCDAVTYHKEHHEEPLWYRIEDHEFISDCLRFSKYEDFWINDKKNTRIFKRTL